MNDSRTASATQQSGEGYWEIEAGDVHGVEKALVSLRKQYASAEAVHEGRAGTRNSVANLVVYAGSEEVAERTTATLERLAGSHPARTILLVADLAPDDPAVKASVSARCSIARGHERICYEEIRLLARGRSAPHLRSVVEPLLLTDLPRVLWWTGEPALQDEIFTTFANMSDRVLIDTHGANNNAHALMQVARLIVDGVLETSLGDLTWGRLKLWRQTLAELFDPPQMTALLPFVRRLRVEVAGPKGTNPASAQALLFVAWLATALDWEPGRAGERTFSGAIRLRLRAAGHDVPVELRPTELEHAAAGELQSVLLEADDGSGLAQIEISRGPGREHARTRVALAGREPVERAVRFQVGDDAMLLSDELDSTERDVLFEEAAEMAGRFAELLPPEGR
jgi:glucose-6-phosphate dehydrogenase assembly protein OpcA